MRVLRRLATLLLIILLMIIPLEGVFGEPLSEEDIFLGKHGVFYQIFVRAFADGNGDGLGDLRGIIDRMDYLTDLGVSGIWLTPIHPSPTYHKYDVTDYYAIDREIGTLEEFEELITKAHSRGIRVIMDLVLHHTSRLHPWFIAATLDPQSPYRDYYIWADSDTNLSAPGPWAQRVWHPHATGHYYGLFWDGMPDLNYDNPKVREEAKAIA
ncbi:MAG TPA: alpha-amylase, partial [Firmicutes bacterium]|nr:alpha-amylase [Bacillota bacterium]